MLYSQNCEVRRQWAAFQLSQDEKAMKEWFKAEKQTQHKRKGKQSRKICKR